MGYLNVGRKRAVDLPASPEDRRVGSDVDQSKPLLLHVFSTFEPGGGGITLRHPGEHLGFAVSACDCRHGWRVLEKVIQNSPR